jgi:pyruvate dehydrogenase E1 component alpha subunit
MITEHTVETLQDFERQVAERFNAGQIRAPVHLAGGNEAQLIEVFKQVDRNDWVFGAWRMHYHCLLKGVPPDELMAEIMGGRSIALSFPSHRILCSAIVGGILPIALGAALSIKRRGGKERVWAFCGDMTATTGAFHECLSYAEGHDLPATFVIEYNGISVCTPTEEVWGPFVEVGGPSHGRVSCSNVIEYSYKLPWPHSGAGKRVEF